MVLQDTRSATAHGEACGKGTWFKAPSIDNKLKDLFPMTATDYISKVLYSQHAGNVTVSQWAGYVWNWEPSSGSAPFTNADFLGAGTLYRGDAATATVSYTNSTLAGALTAMLADYPNDAAAPSHVNPNARTVIDGL
jgi:hypothetical protein